MKNSPRSHDVFFFENFFSQKSHSDHLLKNCKILSGRLLIMIMPVVAKSKHQYCFLGHRFCKAAVVLHKFASGLWVGLLAHSKPIPTSNDPAGQRSPASLQPPTPPS